MKISEALNSAFVALTLNKVRSFLTMLGIIIGVFSVVLLISLVTGVRNYITDEFNAVGSNLIYVMPGMASFNRDPATSFGDNKLSEKHIKMITEDNPNQVQEVTPYVALVKNVTYKTKTYYSTLAAGYANYDVVFSLKMTHGRFFDKNEERSSAKVAVLGSEVKNKLFGNRDPLGEYIKIDGNSFKIIGVMAPKAQDFDQSIGIPYTTARDILDTSSISYIIIKAKQGQDVSTVSRQVELTLLRDIKKGDYTIMTQKDMLNSVQSILGILSLGLVAIAAISLLVGGIGIMNIMLVSVTERIMEIGLRKAVGATPLNIATQFLIESIILSLGGGVLGLGLGFAGSLIGSKFIRTEVPWWAVLLSLGFSIFVGVLFGTYPAISAAKKDPIESLRFE